MCQFRRVFEVIFSGTLREKSRGKRWSAVWMVVVAGMISGAVLSLAPAEAQAQSKKSTKKKAAAKESAKDTASASKSIKYEAYTVTRQAAVLSAPNADPRGVFETGAPIEVLERDRGWVKVRLEGWIRDTMIAPADTQIRKSVAAADLRENPSKWRGSTVEWTVEYLSLQKADTLRKGLSPGENYMLARGPSREQALLYLVLSDEQLGTVRALPPLAKATVVARVRTARSEPAGVPILEVKSLQPLE